MQTRPLEGVLHDRPRAATALVVLVLAFAFTAVAVLLGLTRGFDVATLLFLDANLPESLSGTMLFFTTIGYYRVCAVLAFAAAGVFFFLGWRVSAMAILVSTPGGMIATTILKYTFGRERPDLIDSGYTAGYLSFPSGHATMAVGFYGFLAVILFLHLQGPLRWVVAATGVFVAAMISLSRMYLGVHYPSDVLAGALVPPTLLALAALISSRRGKKPAA
ncbi:phosphatase PAP2 family protein [Rubrobacter indicoceani]|uniref:phosphatase PAP2 family protein n=1 Tax=Rubrobacter indicoceani TaxID=2051957 RepID=UPI0013C44C11|nr:phosphatase PAP2 family protein [Rubrobacter indicoceani]